MEPMTWTVLFRMLDVMDIQPGTNIKLDVQQEGDGQSAPPSVNILMVPDSTEADANAEVTIVSGYEVHPVTGVLIPGPALTGPQLRGSMKERNLQAFEEGKKAFIDRVTKWAEKYIKVMLLKGSKVEVTGQL